MSVTYIDSDSDLIPAAAALLDSSRIAVDLEFDRNFYRYGFNMCLMQIFDGNCCYLIDPLSRNLDIKSIFPVLENPSIEKITFAFGEDLRLLHSIGCFPRNIYDLNIATSLLSYPPASLNSLLQDVLGVNTGTSTQRSNWFKRPLTDNQIRYAAQDVLHLFDLQDLLHTEAQKKEISHWIEQENRVWDELDYSDEDHNGTVKEKDKKSLSETEWHLFKGLMELREETAKSFNKPGFQIIPNSLLKRIAQKPTLAESFTGLNDVFRGIKNNRFQKKLVQLICQKLEEAEKLGLSPDKPAQKPLSNDEFRTLQRKKNKVNLYKSKLFDPVKEKLIEEYGEEATTFIFSNRIIENIVDGDSAELKSYKVDILKTYATRLQLDPMVLEELLSE
jgi:ribonuclease D